MRHNLLLLLLVASLCHACTAVRRVRNKFYTKVSPAEATRLLAQGPFVETLVLDSTYALFVRQICRPRPPAGFYTSGRPTLVASVERCDCDDSTKTYAKEKLEIEYLLISPVHRRFVYLTTVPPEVRNGVLRYDRLLFLTDNFVNVSTINTFFFGRVTDGELLLHRLGTVASPGIYPAPERWLYSLSPQKDVLTLDAVAQEAEGYGRYSLPGRILGLPVRFYRKDAWRVGITREYEQPTPAAAGARYLLGPALHLIRPAEDAPPQKVLLQFDGTFSTQYAALFFHGDRVIALPDPTAR